MDGFSQKFKTMDTLHMQDDSAPIRASFQPIIRESLSNLNLEDKSYFDHAQYQDAKATEKNIASKYYQKEAQYISQIVCGVKRYSC